MSRRPRTIATTLGTDLRRVGSDWVIDLTSLPLLHGLSVLSRALVEQIAEQTDDLDLVRPLRASENPELSGLGCDGIRVRTARRQLRALLRARDDFEHHLRAVLGTLQQERWREHILPADPRAPSTALVFRFPQGGRRGPCFVLERERTTSHGRRFLLRVTITETEPRASADHGARVRVDDLGGREYIAGSTRIAQTLRDMAHREAERGRRAHVERRKEGSFVFERLDRGGLDHLELVQLSWGEQIRSRLAEPEPTWLDHVLKKTLLVLEDQAIRTELRRGRRVQMRDGEVCVYVDLSQRGRALNLAVDQPRHRLDLDAYLDRMPTLDAVVRRHAATRPFADHCVLLIHHITSEVLGTIAALQALGCPDLRVLFVRYASDIPPEYLDALLDGGDDLHCVALQSRHDPGEIEGHFILSRQFSPLGPLDALDARLHDTPTGYFDAMVAVAVHCFLRQLADACATNRRILVVEDGGYLAPVLHRMADGTVGTLADAHGVRGLPARLRRRRLRTVLEERLVGSVEHTRNGFDRLAAVARTHGLVRPAYSIATSRLKTEEESQEVAATVLAAIETVYHALGFVLSHRRALVIGSRGAIGVKLVQALGSRTRAGRPLGLDLRVRRPSRREGRTWKDLPVTTRRAVDLLIGVTGIAALGHEEIEELLVHGTASMLVLASGSTKTVEFARIAAWIEALGGASTPRIGGEPAELRGEELLDPQSGRVYGTGFTVRIGRGRRARTKRLVFLANLTPVNFMFYGVPTEVMDHVMAQLVRASLTLTRAVASPRGLAPRLYAIDRDVPDARLR